MAVNLKGRSFLTLEDFTPAEIRYLLDLGHDLKAKRRAGICDPALQGKHIVLLFEKTSTRTRCSFEVAATQEGAHVTYLDANSSQMGKKESLEDANIVRFGKRFRRICGQSAGQAVFYFVYPSPSGPMPVDSLPENTRLERAMKAHYQSGKVVYEMFGYFFPEREN